MKRLDEVDFILAQLEDVLHGEEGKKVTYARKLIQQDRFLSDVKNFYKGLSFILHRNIHYLTDVGGSLVEISLPLLGVVAKVDYTLRQAEVKYFDPSLKKSVLETISFDEIEKSKNNENKSV